MRTLLFAFVAMNAVDQGTTYYGRSRGGQEGNPVFHWLFANVGFGWATVIKMSLAAALGVLLYKAGKHWPRAVPAMCVGLVILLVIYLVAVVANVAGA